MLEGKIGGRGTDEEIRVRNKERAEARLGELIQSLRDANDTQKAYNAVAAEARDKIDVMRSCRNGVVSNMLEAVGEFYEDEDEGSVALGWREEEELGRMTLHRGFTGDLVEDNEGSVRSRQSVVVGEERRMIGRIVGENPQLRSVFGLPTGEEEEEEEEEEAFGDDGMRFTSIADLRPDRRTRYLRRLIVKIHGFQIGEGIGGDEEGGGGAQGLEEVGIEGIEKVRRSGQRAGAKAASAMILYTAS